MTSPVLPSGTFFPVAVARAASDALVPVLRLRGHLCTSAPPSAAAPLAFGLPATEMLRDGVNGTGSGSGRDRAGVSVAKLCETDGAVLRGWPPKFPEAAPAMARNRRCRRGNGLGAE